VDDNSKTYQKTPKFYKIFEHFSFPNENSRLFLISMMVTSLENAEYENQIMLLLKFLAEALHAYPEALHYV
jgi:hypothetical protein